MVEIKPSILLISSEFEKMMYFFFLDFNIEHFDHSSKMCNKFIWWFFFKIKILISVHMHTFYLEHGIEKE